MIRVYPLGPPGAPQVPGVASCGVCQEFDQHDHSRLNHHPVYNPPLVAIDLVRERVGHGGGEEALEGELGNQIREPLLRLPASIRLLSPLVELCMID